MATLLQTVMNNIALPPKLPFKADESFETVHQELLSRLLHSTRIVRNATTTDLLPLWQSTRHVLQTCKKLNAGDKLNRCSLLTAFKGLKPNDLLILHVTEQISGLLFHRKLGQSIDPLFLCADWLKSLL